MDHSAQQRYRASNRQHNNDR